MSYDSEDRRRIARMPSSERARKAARTAKVRSDWDKVKVGLLLSLLRHKFRTPEMAAKLVATYPAELVSTNDVEVHVGQALMVVRHELLQRISGMRAARAALASGGSDAESPAPTPTEGLGNPPEPPTAG